MSNVVADAAGLLFGTGGFLAGLAGLIAACTYAWSEHKAWSDEHKGSDQ